MNRQDSRGVQVENKASAGEKGIGPVWGDVSCE